jgi:hypothetical protein
LEPTLIHHSSEEYNLACALRQSISNIIGFGPFFLFQLPFGVPANHNDIAPIHYLPNFGIIPTHMENLDF